MSLQGMWTDRQTVIPKYPITLFLCLWGYNKQNLNLTFTNAPQLRSLTQSMLISEKYLLTNVGTLLPEED